MDCGGQDQFANEESDPPSFAHQFALFFLRGFAANGYVRVDMKRVKARKDEVWMRG